MSQSTLDYSIFKKHESNREIDRSNLRKIKNSIAYKNLLNIRPILVDEEFRIIDGQHRLEAAKQLGIPIFYQICPSSQDEDIILLNANQKKWDILSFLNYYINKGNENYLKLQRYLKEKNITIFTFFSLNSFSGGPDYQKFREGKFLFPDNLENLSERLMYLNDIIAFISPRIPGYKKFIESKSFQRAFFIFMALPDVEYGELKRKIDINLGWIKKSAGVDGYLTMFHEIYNFKRKKNRFAEEGINGMD